MDDQAQKTYEIAVNNQAKMIFMCERITVLESLINNLLKKHDDLIEKHDNCPGKLHAIKSEGAMVFRDKIGTFISVCLSLIISIAAFWQSRAK